MKPRFVLLGLCALALLGGVKIYSDNKTPDDPAFEAWKKRNSLKNVARKAKASGRSEVTVPAPDFEYGDAIDIDQALAAYSVLIAEPVAEMSQLYGGDEVRTWYKFKTHEVVSDAGAPACPTCPPVEPPAELLPLNDGEFLVAQAGGSIKIDGVRVTMVDGHFPPFQKSHKYLLLASMTPSGVARIEIGPTGVFRVNEDGRVEPVNKKPHPIKGGMERRFNSSVAGLKEHLGKKT